MPNPADSPQLQTLLSYCPQIDTIGHLPHWCDLGPDMGWDDCLQHRTACLLAYSPDIYHSIPAALWPIVADLWGEPLNLSTLPALAATMLAGMIYQGTDQAGEAPTQYSETPAAIADQAGEVQIETFGRDDNGNIWRKLPSGRTSTASARSWFQAFAADDAAFSDPFKIFVMQYC